MKNAVTKEPKNRPPKRKNPGSLRIVLLCVMLGIVAGALAGVIIVKAQPAAEKVFAVEDLRITLTEDFQAFENERFTGGLVNRDVGITLLKEPFRAVPGSESLTLEEYGHLVIAENGILGTMLCTEYGLTYFEFVKESQETGQAVAYFAAVYKTDDAFWLVQFGVAGDDYSQWQQKLEDFARSVTFE